MSIPPNQFRRDHPWTRFVLLNSSAGPVPSHVKVTHSLTLSLKKIQLCTCRSTETSTDDVLHGLAGGLTNWLILVAYPLGDQLHIDLKKQIIRCIYSLAPCLCNAIRLEASALAIHKVGVGRPLIDVSSKSMSTNFHSISLRSKPGLIQGNGQKIRPPRVKIR